MSNHKLIRMENGAPRPASEPAPFSPDKILAMKRADTRAAATALTGAAVAIGAERSITEQDEDHGESFPTINVESEEKLAGVLVETLTECPNVAAAAGVTPDELRGDLQASVDARVFVTQSTQVARGAREAKLVLGLAVQAVVTKTTEGLTEIAAAGGPDVAAAARADAETINAPLKAEADKRAARAEDTRRIAAAAGAALKDAQDVARFQEITARISDGAPVNEEDVLWARDFAKDRPELRGPAPLAPAHGDKTDKTDKGNRRQKGR